MNFTIKVENHTPERMNKLELLLGFFVGEGGRLLERKTKSAMLTGKSGRRYKRGKDSIHIASAPGEAPADDSGNLLGSIDLVEVSQLEAVLGTPAEYAPPLETGTSRMAARPMWEKTAKEALPTLERLLRKVVKEARA